MKKRLFGLLMAILMGILNFQVFSADIVQVVIDGKTINFDVDPIVVEGRTLVPMRTIFETLGAKVSWDEVTKTVTGLKGDIKIILKIGSAEATVNGENTKLDVPAMEQKGRTFVPLRFISESFGIAVRWNDEAQTVSIHSDIPFGTLYDDKGQKYIGEYKVVKNIETPHGQGTFYNNQGKIFYQGEVEEAIFQGKGISYRENGTILYQGDFTKGVPQGQGNFYDEKGNLKYEGAVANSLPNGHGKEYMLNIYFYEGEFKDGVRFGKGKIFTQAQLTSEGEFDGDLIRGKVYYDDGAVSIEKHLVKGAGGYNGTVKRYYPDGKLLMEAEVINNLATINTKYYYKDGTIAYEGEEATRVTAKQLSDLIWAK